jgi:hypothetical protein
MNSALRINAQPVVMPFKALTRMRPMPGAARPNARKQNINSEILIAPNDSTTVP